MTNPKLRFKRPDGTAYPDWEKTTVGTLFTPVSEKNRADAVDNVITNSAEYGLIPQRDFFDKDIAVEGKTSNYTIIHKGDFVYNPRKSTTAPFGPFNCYELEEPGIVSPLYTCLKPKDSSLSDYLLWYFQTYKWHPYIKQNGAQGGARHDRVGMTSELMAGIPVTMSGSPDERERVVACLESVNDRLVTQEQYVAALETQKKELLRQVFAREIRFKDENGQDYPEWEKVTVLDLLVQPITDGPHETPELVESGVPFASVEAVVNGKIDLSRRRGNITKEYDEACAKKYKPQKYDVYMVKSGATTGKVAIVTIDEDFNIWSPLAAMRTRNKIEAYYLFYFLQSAYLQDQVMKKMSLGNQPNLGMRALEAFSAFRPSLTEQQRIADFFTALDAQIENERALLEDWRQLKKGLLQQMFI